ncbi:Hypothetical_protein [Hexamita inflata]|uniref:Hypothetical_protein n=1 Tax=Hexamita inflata TaxID=28002 RepID=A0AA86QQQ8_9EUKA|nr:Hypothetical protein HINF_LOCUS45878 [Hexamita inflata]
MTIDKTNITSLLSYAVNLGGVIGYQFFGYISVIQSRVSNLYVNGSSQYWTMVSGFVAGIYNVTNNYFRNVELFNSSLFSLSEIRVACTGGIIGYFIYSDIVITMVNINEITTDAQSILGEGTSSGFISIAHKYNTVNISYVELKFSFIYCNSRYPKAGGIVSIGFYGLVDVKYSSVRNTVVQSSDELFLNQTTPYFIGPMWGLACGFLAQYYNSNINIYQVQLIDSVISVNCSNESSSSGISSQLTTTMLQLSQIVIYNTQIFAISKYKQSFAAGICSTQKSNTSYIDSISVFGSNITSISTTYSFASAVNAHISGMNETIIQVEVLMTTLNSQNNQLGDCSNIGGIYGLVELSNTNTTSCKVITSQFTALNTNAVYMGGLVGYYSFTNSTLVDSSITDSNLSARTVNKDTVVGGAIGFYVSSNVTLFDTNVSNLVLQSFSVSSVYCSSLIGTVRSQYSYNKLIILNSNAYSIQTEYGGSSILANFLVQFQTKGMTQIQTSISNSQSLGFSSMNGVALTNCLFQIRNNTTSYQINDDGC